VHVVVADTTPLNYLVLIDQIDLLQKLFKTVHIPDTVRDELASKGASPRVQNWIAAPPGWLIIKPTPAMSATTTHLDAGERGAIALATKLMAQLLLIDERAGTAVARAQGLTVMGTLGVLDLAAINGIIDLRTALAQLTATNFRVSPRLIDALLMKHGGRQ
jgi:predicted nucleic acid-binding protein